MSKHYIIERLLKLEANSAINLLREKFPITCIEDVERISQDEVDAIYSICNRLKQNEGISDSILNNATTAETTFMEVDYV